MTKPQRQRLYEVDQLTGFAIILVVIGHLVANKPPSGNYWYEILRYGIYKFHMPLFMFLSGIIFGYTMYTRYDWQSYKNWVVKKFLRLAPGFISIGLLIIFGKYFANFFLYVDDPTKNLFFSIGDLFLSPGQSPSGSLWYIYVLLELYLVFPLLMPVIEKSIWPILIISACLNYLSTQFIVSEFLMANTFCGYSLYFSLGIAAIRHYPAFCEGTERFRFLLAGLFLSSFLIVFLLPERESKSLIGICSIPACFYWLGSLQTRWTSFFSWVGKYSYTIYLLNTIFIGLSKAFLLKILPWDGINFLLFFVVLFTAGLFGPIYSHRWVLSKIPYLGTITR